MPNDDKLADIVRQLEIVFEYLREQQLTLRAIRTMIDELKP